MKLVVPAGTAAFLSTGFLYAYLPLLVLFEKEPPPHPPPVSASQTEYGQARDTTLLIPCYKSEKLISSTLEAALKVFPRENIFVVANGNSPTPLDNTAAVCERYGVSHTWSSIDSKMVAQFVGCYVAKQFRNMLLIDDDCLLPPNFPIVTDRFTLSVKCVGYTIKSVGTSSSKGTLSQQAQDVEIQYEWDSASICWQDWISYLPSRSDQYLGSLNAHQNVPGSSGFLGVGGLVLWTCCAPAWLSHPDVYCRFEIYETLLYLLAPFVLPISFYVRPNFSGYLFAATLLMYMVNTVIFKYAHLCLRDESVSVGCLLYYLPYKMILTFVNIASCYYSIWKYAKYFAKRHPKVIEDENAVAVVLRLEEGSVSETKSAANLTGLSSVDSGSHRPRRFTVTAVGTNLSSIAKEPLLEESALGDIEVVDFATHGIPQLASVPENELPSEPQAVSGSRTGPVPPPKPPPRRPFSWHRSASNNSSGSNVSPLDECKKLQFPNVSTLDERERLSSPLPSSETPSAEESSAEQHTPVTRHPSPVFFKRSLSTNLLCGSSLRHTPLTRQLTGAPPLHALPRRPPSIIFHTGPHYSLAPISDLHILSTNSRPENGHRGFTVVSSAGDVGRGWPLRREALVSDRDVSGPSDNGILQPWSKCSRRSKGRVVITEGDGGDQRVGSAFTARERIGVDQRGSFPRLA
ncbi:MAG: hypothetical protein LQ341_006084, partial [Variospora aurantia]